MLTIPNTDNMVETDYEISVTPITLADGTTIPSTKVPVHTGTCSFVRAATLTALHERVHFSEETSVDAEIRAFEKIMNYESSFAQQPLFLVISTADPPYPHIRYSLPPRIVHAG